VSPRGVVGRVVGLQRLDPSRKQLRSRARCVNRADNAIWAGRIDLEDPDKEPAIRDVRHERAHHEHPNPILPLLGHPNTVDGALSRLRQSVVIDNDRRRQPLTSEGARRCQGSDEIVH
jgi:hypothetical protein